MNFQIIVCLLIIFTNSVSKSTPLDPIAVPSICEKILSEGEASLYQWQVNLSDWEPYSGDETYALINPRELEAHVYSRETAVGNGFGNWLDRKDQLPLASFNETQYPYYFSSDENTYINQKYQSLTTLRNLLGHWLKFQVLVTPYKVKNIFETTAEDPKIEEIVVGRLLAIQKKSIVIETITGVVKEIRVGDYWAGLQPVFIKQADLLPRGRATQTSSVYYGASGILGPMGPVQSSASNNSKSVLPEEYYTGTNEELRVSRSLVISSVRPNEYVPGVNSYLGQTVAASVLTVNIYGERVMSHLVQGQVVAEFKNGFRLKSGETILDIVAPDPHQGFIFIKIINE